MVHLSPIQHFLGNQVSSALAQKFGTKVSVGRVDVGFFNRIIIDDVMMYDQKGDSMLYESPATTNDSWGYKPHDQNWKSAERIRRDREHLASIGANYLLNVGPDGLGRIPSPAVAALLSAKGNG